jgi:hypothetical protein
MSVYEVDVEDLYSDESFLNEIIKILPEDIHFLCFLLNNNNSEKINIKSLVKMWEEVSELEDPLDCYGCGMNRWWGNPVAYLAVQKNLPSSALNQINELVEQVSEAYIDDPRKFEDDLDIIRLSLASNENTPVEVLQKLLKIDRNPMQATDDQYPFFDENDKGTANISELARRTIAKLTA